MVQWVSQTVASIYNYTTTAERNATQHKGTDGQLSCWGVMNCHITTTPIQSAQLPAMNIIKIATPIIQTRL